jgi:acetolactate synthase-1/2/3 large subunit
VVWLGGDGAFMMVLSELATAVAYKIPVIAVINHNSAYGNEKFSQWTRYQGRFIGTDLPIPDLAAVAQAFGAHGERVEDPDQIKPALERAVAAHRPAVIDVILDNSIEELDPSPVRRS